MSRRRCHHGVNGPTGPSLMMLVKCVFTYRVKCRNCRLSMSAGFRFRPRAAEYARAYFELYQVDEWEWVLWDRQLDAALDHRGVER